MYLHIDYRKWRPPRRQTRVTCSCMVADQGLWARAWVAT